MNISIIEADICDADEILALQKAAYQSEAIINNDWTIPPLTQTLSEIKKEFADKFFLKAVMEQRVVGSVRGILNGTTCLIGRLIVHPDYQNKGIGTMLMASIEKAFSNAERFELFTGAKSKNNILFYKKLGYKKCREEDLSSNVRLIFMEKLK